MKKIFVLLFLANTIVAQNVSYHVSEDFTDIKSKFDFGIFKFDNNLYGNVYYLKGDCFKIQTFDSTFNKVTQELTVALPEECKKAKNAVFNQYKNNFYCFYTTLQNKVGTLYALSFDTKTLKFSQESKKLFEVNDIQKGAFYGEFGYTPNADSSLILVQYFKEYISKGDFNNNFATIGYVTFDNKLNTKQSIEMQYPYRIGDDAFSTTCSYFDKNGGVFILTPVRVNNSIDGMNISENKTLKRHELLKLNKEKNTWEKLKIELGDKKYINSIKIFKDENNNLLLGGGYTTVSPEDKSFSKNSSDGIYILQINTSNNQLIKQSADFIEFPDNIIKLYEDKYKLKNMDKNGNNEVEGSIYPKFSLNKDKSLTIICSFKTYYSSNDPNSINSGTTTNSTINEDFLYLKLNPNRKLDWCHKIPRTQYENTEFMTYYYNNSNDNDYLFYFDNSENLNLTTEDKPHGYKPGENGSLFCVKIDSNGNLTKSLLFDTKNFKGKVLSSLYEKINDGSFVVKSNDSQASKIFKIDIK